MLKNHEILMKTPIFRFNCAALYLDKYCQIVRLSNFSIQLTIKTRLTVTIGSELNLK